MTALRQNAMKELEKVPEDKLSFVIQIMQGVNGLYYDNQEERKEAFDRLERIIFLQGSHFMKMREGLSLLAWMGE